MPLGWGWDNPMFSYVIHYNMPKTSRPTIRRSAVPGEMGSQGLYSALCSTGYADSKFFIEQSNFEPVRRSGSIRSCGQLLLLLHTGMPAQLYIIILGRDRQMWQCNN